MQTMSTTTSYLSLYQFTPGRTLFALSGMQAILTPAEAALLDDLITAARAAGEHQLARLLVWSAERGLRLTRPDAAKIDPVADGLLGSVYSSAQRAVDTLPPTHPVHKAARKLLDRHFARGAITITTLRYEDQLAASKVLVAELDAPEQADLVSKLGLGLYLDELRPLLVSYEAALRPGSGRSLTWEDVLADQANTQETLARVVVRVLDRFDEPTRTRLLAPIDHQNSLIAAAYRARRPLGDVDPKTGLEGEATPPLPEAEAPVAPG
jgi:hypothetical protein